MAVHTINPYRLDTLQFVGRYDVSNKNIQQQYTHALVARNCRPLLLTVDAPGGG